MGAEREVGLATPGDLTLLLPAVQSAVTAEVVYSGPVEAPIAAGEEIAELVVSIDGMEPRRVTLVAETDVPRGGFYTRLLTAAQSLVSQYVGEAASLW
jgi:serine-type D-Ala-D-Ala carboxypeptidase (penicillin-binding protein 5/6)